MKLLLRWNHDHGYKCQIHSDISVPDSMDHIIFKLSVEMDLFTLFKNHSIDNSLEKSYQKRKPIQLNK